MLCERRNPHPVYDAFMRLRFSRVFEQETHRRAVVGIHGTGEAN